MFFKSLVFLDWVVIKKVWKRERPSPSWHVNVLSGWEPTGRTGRWEISIGYPHPPICAPFRYLWYHTNRRDLPRDSLANNWLALDVYTRPAPTWSHLLLGIYLLQTSSAPVGPTHYALMHVHDSMFMYASLASYHPCIIVSCFSAFAAFSFLSALFLIQYTVNKYVKTYIF